MAKLFEVHLPDGMSVVKLDSQGRATVQYTVKNVSAREIDGRAVLVSLPVAKPPSGAVEKGWVKVDGKTDRHFGINKEETFTVKISVPPKGTAPGDYTFRLDAVWVEQTDQGDPGSAIRFSVAPPPPQGKFPLWIIPVVVVVLIATGVGIWLAVSGGGPKVPDLIGKTVTDAGNQLQAVGLKLDPNMQTAESKPEDSGKIVATSPAAGQKATKGQTVQVTVGAQMVTVPVLIGHTYLEVQSRILPDLHLAQGQTIPTQNPNFAAGVVVDQNPAPQQVVKAGTAMDLRVTPQPVSVANVVGQTLGNAINALKPLTVNAWNGDSTQKVISQNPPPGASVPVGTSVTLVFPPPLGGCQFVLCVYQGAIARQMVLEQAVRTRDLENGKASQ